MKSIGALPQNQAHVSVLIDLDHVLLLILTKQT